MQIGIIGAGNVGGTLGQKWAAAGHGVAFGVRDIKSPKMTALLESVASSARVVSVADAIAFGETVVLATPYAAVEETVRSHRQALAGKIVVDATNNFGADVVNNIETILTHVPDATVYRAFNSLGWENFYQPNFGKLTADLFYCGPDGGTRRLIESLIGDVGLRPIWVGDLDVAPVVDSVGTLWVTLALRRGMGRRLAFKLLTE